MIPEVFSPTKEENHGSQKNLGLPGGSLIEGSTFPGRMSPETVGRYDWDSHPLVFFGARFRAFGAGAFI